MKTTQSCPECGSFIPDDAPFGVCPTCLMQSAVGGEESMTQRRPAEEPGTHVGNYRLVAKLGEGGFGEVYEAEQEEPVQRRVALKLLKRGMDTRSVVARFEAERQALALMDHPNVATVYDAGESADGRPFFVMELVEGSPITDFSREHGLDLKARLALFIAVCEGVQHAHSKGIIHRDIKPSNVLVATRDGKMVPKVIDFGVAKATDHILTEKTVYTELGRKVGTPVYMSPEQAAGKADVDIRSDVYSLGALLYELLTGQTPFDLDQLRNVGQAETERILSEDTPPKPSTRITTLGGDRRAAGRLRGDLDWIVMRALEKDPDRRYPTALGLANDVRRHLSCKAVEAGPPSRLYLMGRFARRNKAFIGAVTGIFLALVAGTVVSTWQAIRATRAEEESTRQAERARIAERDARQEAAVGDSLTAFLTDNVVAAAFEGGIPDSTLKIMAVMAMAEEHLVRLDHQPLVQAGGYLIMGRLYHWSGFPARALPLTQQSLSLYRREMGPTHEKTLQALEDHLRVLLALKSYSEVDAELEATLPAVEAALPPQHPRVVNLLNVRHDCFALQEKHEERALVLRRLLESDFANATIWSNLRHVHTTLSLRAFESGRHDEAIEEIVAASVFAAVHNRGGYWHDDGVYTISIRRKFIAAGIAPEDADWNNFENVLNPIDLDTLPARFDVSGPAATMIRAYLQHVRGDSAGAAETLRPVARNHPTVHCLQNALGFYLEQAGSREAERSYFAAARLAADQQARAPLLWYGANWDRLRRRHSIPFNAHALPRSAPVRAPSSGHVYQRLDIPLSFEDARTACEDLGGTLAIVTDADENQLLYSRLATSHTCWLGASRGPGEHSWRWIDGSALSYSNWKGGREPGIDASNEATFGLVFGNTAPFTIYESNYHADWADEWVPRESRGLVLSKSVEDPHHNALFIFPICEWESEERWLQSRDDQRRP